MEYYSSSQFPFSYRDYLMFLFLRPLLAVSFALSLLFVGWFLAWKLVLVHVPLVQEIFEFLLVKIIIIEALENSRLTIKILDNMVEDCQFNRFTVHKSSW
ncbi:unnamed protein product [Fraxinus pennsylvanica]|uniref:Uncharacterized protein n=1 Tax=Fraxinus pennsylvanica TaxID=56036 RepID=A0AAD1YN08_9LAMI|nr:unnamed protein product [Fraxinus pennsylvanica]